MNARREAQPATERTAVFRQRWTGAREAGKMGKKRNPGQEKDRD